MNYSSTNLQWMDLIFIQPQVKCVWECVSKCVFAHAAFHSTQKMRISTWKGQEMLENKISLYDTNMANMAKYNDITDTITVL